MQLVSIIMATYNGQKYLNQQIDSILTQTYSNIELIVIDDCSTDGSLEILNRYAQLDSRVKIYSSEKNLGVIATFEKGLGFANGELIALSDQDDIFRNDKITVLVEALETKPNRDLVLSDLNLINEFDEELASSLWHYQKLNPTDGKPFKRLVYRNFATGCAMMFRRKLLSLALPFPDGVHMHDWWIALISTSSRFGGICLINDALTSYRQHGANVFGAQKAEPIAIHSLFNRTINAFSLPHSELYKVNTLDVSRLNGYLNLDIWDANEIKIIEAVKSLNYEYINDKDHSFFKRLSKIPQRLKYTLICDGAWACGRVIFFTLWPSK